MSDATTQTPAQLLTNAAVLVERARDALDISTVVSCDHCRKTKFVCATDATVHKKIVDLPLKLERLAHYLDHGV